MYIGFISAFDDCRRVAAECIPVRLYLSGLDLTPTYKNVQNKFSVRYFLNLVLVDEEDRRQAQYLTARRLGIQAAYTVSSESCLHLRVARLTWERMAGCSCLQVFQEAGDHFVAKEDRVIGAIFIRGAPGAIASGFKDPT